MVTDWQKTLGIWQNQSETGGSISPTGKVQDYVGIAIEDAWPEACAEPAGVINPGDGGGEGGA